MSEVKITPDIGVINYEIKINTNRILKDHHLLEVSPYFLVRLGESVSSKVKNKEILPPKYYLLLLATCPSLYCKILN